MSDHTSSSLNRNGILEQLENHIKFKVEFIKALLELRSKEPNENYTRIFEDVFKTFSEVDELVDTLTINVEHEKSFVKYISSLLKSNESQMLNLKKLSEKIKERKEVGKDSQEKESGPPEAKPTEPLKKPPISKIQNSGKIPPYRTFKNTTPSISKSDKINTFKNRNGITPRPGIPNRKTL